MSDEFSLDTIAANLLLCREVKRDEFGDPCPWGVRHILTFDDLSEHFWLYFSSAGLVANSSHLLTIKVAGIEKPVMRRSRKANNSGVIQGCLRDRLTAASEGRVLFSLFLDGDAVAHFTVRITAIKRPRIKGGQGGPESMPPS